MLSPSSYGDIQWYALTSLDLYLKTGTCREWSVVREDIMKHPAKCRYGHKFFITPVFSLKIPLGLVYAALVAGIAEQWQYLTLTLKH